MWFVTLKKVYK